MLKLVLVTLLIFGGYCSDEVADYYWKEYFGAIPHDAIVAGRTLAGKKVYIGQAYLRDQGLFVAQITPGVPEVYVPEKEIINRVDKYIKILCGPKENFYWMKANASSLGQLLADKHAVLGGHEDGQGYMNVGRINKGGNTIVGKVNTFWVQAPGFHYNDSGVEQVLHTYEILIYHPPNPDILL